MAAKQNQLAPRKADDDDLALTRLKSDIDHTRLRIDRTLDQLAEQLQPKVFMDTIMQNIKESSRDAAKRAGHIASDTGRSLWQFVRDNPLPTALIASGLTYIAVRQRLADRPSNAESPAPQPSTSSSDAQQRDEAIRDRVQQVGQRARAEGKSFLQSARQRMRQTARQLRATAQQSGEKTSQWMEQARHSVAQTGEKLQEKTHEVGEQIERGQQAAMRTARNHPLMVAGAVAAVGAVLGALIPRSRREDRMLGESADQLKQRARDKAQQAGEQVEHALQKGVRRAGEEMQRMGSELQR